MKYINESEAYRNKISDILSKGRGWGMEQFDERLVYGVSFDEDKFQDEILSRAIYDIVVRN